MALHIVISERAEKNLDTIIAYLEKEWSDKVKKNFIKKLSKTINQIASNPTMYPKSTIKKHVRKCVITKHTTIYYKINSNELQIITIQDTRQNPAFLKL